MAIDRRPLLAKIHIGKKMLGWSDNLYREVLLKQYGQNTSTKLTLHQLSDLVNYMAAQGVQYTNSRKRSPQPRRDFYEIPEGTPFARQKRYIAAMWNALDWKMSGLDVRARSQFGVDKFLWINDQAALQTLAKDLFNRCNRKGVNPLDLPEAR